MSRAFLALIITAMTAAITVAQSTDYTKSEVYVGYSNGQVESGGSSAGAISGFFSDRKTFHGFESAGVYNFTRYVGIKADVSGTYKNESFGGTFTNPINSTSATISGSNNLSLYNVLGGIQVKDNSRDKTFKPFAHALGGIAHLRTAVKDFSCVGTACGTGVFANQTFSDTQAAAAFGGGLDIRVNDRIDFRVAQGDYNPVFTSDGTIHNFRFGIGIVIK